MSLQEFGHKESRAEARRRVLVVMGWWDEWNECVVLKMMHKRVSECVCVCECVQAQQMPIRALCECILERGFSKGVRSSKKGLKIHIFSGKIKSESACTRGLSALGHAFARRSR